MLGAVVLLHDSPHKDMGDVASWRGQRRAELLCHRFEIAHHVVFEAGGLLPRSAAIPTQRPPHVATPSELHRRPDALVIATRSHHCRAGGCREARFIGRCWRSQLPCLATVWNNGRGVGHGDAGGIGCRKQSRRNGRAQGAEWKLSQMNVQHE